MVQEIERFGAELQADAFPQREFTMKRKGDLPRTESAQNIAPKIALDFGSGQGSGWSSERGEIETLATGILGSIEIQRLSRHQVRTNVRTPDIQIRRKRGPCEKDTVSRPVAKQDCRDAIVRRGEGRDDGPVQALTNVEVRRAPCARVHIALIGEHHGIVRLAVRQVINRVCPGVRHEQMQTGTEPPVELKPCA